MTSPNTPTAERFDCSAISDLDSSLFEKYRIIARDGSLRAFDPERIGSAIAKALLAAKGGDYLTEPLHELASTLCRQLCKQVCARRPNGGTYMVEEIQDQAELVLMRAEQYDAAKRFVLYREAHRQARSTH